MARYQPWEIVDIGTRVRYNRERPPSRYNGRLATVLEQGPSTQGPVFKQRMVFVQFDNGPKIRVYVHNLERIEDVATRKLVGPKPKPPLEPEHPTPWTYSQNTVHDANGNTVFRIANPDRFTTMEMRKGTLLAAAIVEAMNEKHKEEDASAPW